MLWPCQPSSFLCAHIASRLLIQVQLRSDLINSNIGCPSLFPPASPSMPLALCPLPFVIRLLPFAFCLLPFPHYPFPIAYAPTVAFLSLAFPHSILPNVDSTMRSFAIVRESKQLCCLGCYPVARRICG